MSTTLPDRTETESAPVTSIGHWIGGANVAGHVGPQRPRLQPGDRRADRRGRLRLGRGDRRAPSRAAKAAFPAWRALSLVEARRAHVRDPRARARAPRGHRGAPDRRARQGALGRDGRGRPRPRGDRVRLRHPDAGQGRLLGAGLDRRRRLLDPPAARRRRRHHAVQLPGHGAHVDVGAGARLRQLLHPQAVREGPERVALRRRAAEGGGLPDGVFNVVHGRQGRGRRAARAPGRRSRSASSARRRSRATSTRPARRTASACRRSAGRRTTWSSFPTPTSTWRPTPPSAPPTARRASAAWPSPSSSRSATSGDELVDAIKERLPKREGRPRHRPDLGDGAADHPRAPRQGRLLHRHAAASRARRSSPTGASSTSTATASSSASRCSTTSRRRWTATSDEIFGPVLSVVRVDTYDEALKLVNENPYGNGTAIFTRDGGVARQFQFEANAGMVGVNVPIPVPGRLLLLRRLERLALRRLARLRAGVDPLLHARQGRHEPLARPGDEQGRPRVPADEVTAAASRRKYGVGGGSRARACAVRLVRISRPRPWLT